MANTAASTLITRTLDNLSRVSAGTTRSGETLDTRALDWLNRVMYRMARAHNFRELYTTSTPSTAASTYTYTLPTNWKTLSTITVRDTTSPVKLKGMTQRQFDLLSPYPANDTKAKPTQYVLHGNQYDLYPVPDDIYTLQIRYYKWPTIITSVATAIDYEPNKDDIIVAGMTGEGFDFLQMYEDGKAWTEKFLVMAKEAIVLDTRQPDLEPLVEGYDAHTNLTIASVGMPTTGGGNG